MWKKLVDIAVVGTFLLTFVLVIQNWQHPFQSFSISRDKLQILSVIAMLAAAGLNYSAYGSRFHKQVSQATSIGDHRGKPEEAARLNDRPSKPDDRPAEGPMGDKSEKPLADRVGALAYDLLRFANQCGPWEPSVKYSKKVKDGFMREFSTSVDALVSELMLSGFSDPEVMLLLSKGDYTWHDVRRLSGLLLIIRTQIELKQLGMIREVRPRSTSKD